MKLEPRGITSTSDGLTTDGPKDLDEQSWGEVSHDIHQCTVGIALSGHLWREYTGAIARIQVLRMVLRSRDLAASRLEPPLASTCSSRA